MFYKKNGKTHLDSANCKNTVFPLCFPLVNMYNLERQSDNNSDVESQLPS